MSDVGIDVAMWSPLHRPIIMLHRQVILLLPSRHPYICTQSVHFFFFFVAACDRLLSGPGETLRSFKPNCESLSSAARLAATNPVPVGRVAPAASSTLHTPQHGNVGVLSVRRRKNSAAAGTTSSLLTSHWL